jgi:hypothetical protein
MATQSLPTTHGDARPASADGFVRAESDSSRGRTERQGTFGRLTHYRYVAPARGQIPPGTRRKLYSTGVFDLDAGEVCVALPDAGGRFLSMMVIDQNQMLFAVVHGACTHTFTRKMLGTRYMRLMIRLLVDPSDPQDMRQAHLVQDRIRLEQPGGPGEFQRLETGPLRITRRPAPRRRRARRRD